MDEDIHQLIELVQDVRVQTFKTLSEVNKKIDDIEIHPAHHPLVQHYYITLALFHEDITNFVLIRGSQDMDKRIALVEHDSEIDTLAAVNADAIRNRKKTYDD